MGLWNDIEADYEFERTYPFGIAGDTWTTKNGRKIKVKEMSETHIRNCMRIVGEDDDWYFVFKQELGRRRKAR